MWQQRLKAWLDSMRARLARRDRTTGADTEEYEGRYESGVGRSAGRFDLRRSAVPITVAAIAVLSAVALITHPPVQGVGRGEVGVRINHLTGTVSEWSEGSVFVLPGLQRMRVFSLRDQSWRAAQMSRADGPAPLQSVEGLSLGADLTVRYAIDPLKVAALAKSLPDDVGTEIVEPAAQGVIYKVFARYTVREIFSTKRSEIQAAVETELKPQPRRRRRRPAQRADRQDRSAGRLQARHGEPARRGARRREDEVHARPQGKAGQGDRADGEVGEGAPRDRRRGRGARAGHRRQGPGRSDEARAAVQAAPDRAAPARGRGDEGDAHQGRRGERAGAPHRGERRGRGAPEARRCRGLSPRQGRQVERRADGRARAR